MTRPARKKAASGVAGKLKGPARGRRAKPVTGAIAHEREAVLAVLRQIVPMLGAMVGSHVEVVLHDLTRPENSVLVIANGHVTGRIPGSPVLSSPGNDKALAILAQGLEFAGPGEHVPVFPYPTFARDGRELSSGTVMFRDASGCTFAALCVNVDASGIDAARELLSRLLPRQDPAVPTSLAPAPDMETLMQEIIDDAVRQYGKSVVAMNKEEKTSAVESMFERGLFIVKGGVERAAKALGVTRFTVYNYLETVKKRRSAP